MLEDIQKLGKDKLDGLSPVDRKKGVLEAFAFQPSFQPEEERGKENKYVEIILNLDTINEKIEIIGGKEIVKKDASEEKDLVFRDKGRGRKLYAQANNHYYMMYFVSDMIDEFEKGSIVKDNIVSNNDFSEWLKPIHEIFYRDDKKKWFKEAILLNSFRDILEEEEIEQLEKGYTKIKDYKDLFRVIISKKLNSTLSHVDKLNHFSFTVNGEKIDKGHPYYKDYLDIIYYKKIGNRFQSNEIAHNKLCHSCNTKTDVVNRVTSKLPIYITDKENFFQDQQIKNAHKSFALCKKCYEEYVVGSLIIRQDYLIRVMGENVLFVPRNISDYEKEIYNNKLKAVKNTFDKLDNYKINDVEKLSDSNRTLNQNNHRLFYDLMISSIDSSALKIDEIIRGVDFLKFEEMFENLEDSIYRYTKNDELKERLYSISLYNIYSILIKNVHGQDERDNLRKKILLSFLGKYKLSEEMLYEKFIIGIKEDFKSRGSAYKAKYKSIKFQIILDFLRKQNNVNEEEIILEETKLVKLLSQREYSKDIKEYFSINPTYKNNIETQGAYLLGYLIGNIYSRERNQSKSILNQINIADIDIYSLKEALDTIYNKLKNNKVKIGGDKVELLRLVKKEYNAALARINNIQDFRVSEVKISTCIYEGISFGMLKKSKKENDDNE